MLTLWYSNLNKNQFLLNSYDFASASSSELSNKLFAMLKRTDSNDELIRRIFNVVLNS